MAFAQRMFPDELREFLAAEPSKQLQDYFGHLLLPNEDRALLLVAHGVVERMLGDMISPRLSHPSIWLDDADFRARTNLARALGLIDDQGLAACRVLNRARNEAAHRLEPVSEKWKVELERVGLWADPPEARQKTFVAILQAVIVVIGAPWLYARIQESYRTLKENHKQEWMDLMAEKLRTLDDPTQVLLDEERKTKLCQEIDVLLARRLRGDSDG